MKFVFRIAAALAGAALWLAVPGPAAAQPATSGKSMRILIPFSPGGTNDVLARLLAPRLGERLGLSVVVDNRPGGNTVIASEALLAAPPDGLTLLLPGNSHVLVPYLSKAPLPFDSVKDFVPVATLARTGLFLVVNPALPAHNLREFIAYATARPGALNCASPGASMNQLAMEVFDGLAGVKLTHIPYKGSGPAVADVIGGQADLSFQTPATVLGFVKAGKLRALAVSGETAYADPPVPTFTQSGLPGFDVELFFGLLAPRGTPRPAVDRIAGAVAQILASADFKEQVAAQGLQAFISTPEQFGALLQSESDRFARVVKAAHIQAE